MIVLACILFNNFLFWKISKKIVGANLPVHIWIFTSVSKKFLKNPFDYVTFPLFFLQILHKASIVKVKFIVNSTENDITSLTWATNILLASKNITTKDSCIYYSIRICFFCFNIEMKIYFYWLYLKWAMGHGWLIAVQFALLFVLRCFADFAEIRHFFFLILYSIFLCSVQWERVCFLLLCFLSNNNSLMLFFLFVLCFSFKHHIKYVVFLVLHWT